MIALRITDSDAEAVLTALRNQLEFWEVERSRMKGKIAGPPWRLACEQVESWRNVLHRVETAYDELED